MLYVYYVYSFQVLWYAILLALVFAVEVGAGALAYFYKGR